MRHDALVDPSYSITEQPAHSNRCGRVCRCRLVIIVALIVAFHTQAFASFPELRFSAKSIEHEEILLEGVRGELSAEGAYRLDASRTELPGQSIEFADLVVQGSVQELSFPDEGVILRTVFQAGIIKAALEYTRNPSGQSIRLNLPDQDLLALRGWPGIPSYADWISSGRVDTEIVYLEKGSAPPRLMVRLGLSGLAFDSPDGLFAAESLAVGLKIEASIDGLKSPVVDGAITGGELLINDFYRNFSNGEMQFAFKPSWDEKGVEIPSFLLTDQYCVTVEGSAGLEFDGGPDGWRLEINRLDLGFPGAYERYIEPMAAAMTLDGLGITGKISWSGLWDEGKFRSGDLVVTDLSVVDTLRNRFAVTGLDVRMRPGDHAFDSRLNWRGLLLGRVNLGAGELALDSAPGKFAIIQPLKLDVLGGQLVLSELAVLLPGMSGNEADEPDIRLKADLENLDMEQLTVAFDWPRFSGKISGNIPGVSLDDGVLSVEGKILVRVFDGTLTIGELQVERAFGVLPSLAVNVEAEGLDLDLLTQTFSFGQISGRIDGYIRDLRMLDWKPVAFDAWFGTPAGQKGSKDISRKAVNHLTSLGGGGATAALTSPVMKLFSSFSYKSLGFGCLMQNNVCDIRGVSEDASSVLIMEGAGVPKVTIRAFNRRVDWPQLVSQLLAASEGESIKIGNQ